VVDRLNATDEMLMGASTTLGSARIIQVIWRFAAQVPGAALRAEWDRLDQGRLSRSAVPALVPGARRKWLPSTNAEPPHEDTRPLADGCLLDWLDRQVRVPLPAGSDALWRLAAVPYRGGSLVSLTVPHFRSDGLGVFAALCQRVPRSVPRSGLADDVVEALGQATHAIGGTARWLMDPARRARLGAVRRTSHNIHNGRSGSAEPRFFVSAGYALDADEWQNCAANHGGTTNSLFVEIAANLIRAGAPVGDRATIDVGIPVSLRQGDTDGRANALVVVPLAVPAGAPHHGALTGTRSDTKVLLERTGADSGTVVPEALWHLLPRRWADRLKAPGAQQTDVVASNFGDVPEDVVRFAGLRADSVALRTMNVPGLVPGKARLRAALCLLRVADRLTVTATGMPDQFGDVESFGRLVGDEFAAWGLRAQRWF
jgi:diacylglycerol O-acyltransferase / wax synthase